MLHLGVESATEKQINHMPHSEQFNRLRARLSHQEFDQIIIRINELIDAAGAEIATTGWLPGSDWNGTPFQLINDKAARLNRDVSRRFFGQLVWYTVIRRPEAWSCGRYPQNEEDVCSMTYFRVNI